MKKRVFTNEEYVERHFKDAERGKDGLFKGCPTDYDLENENFATFSCFGSVSCERCWKLPAIHKGEFVFEDEKKEEIESDEDKPEQKLYTESEVVDLLVKVADKGTCSCCKYYHDDACNDDCKSGITKFLREDKKVKEDCL